MPGLKGKVAIVTGGSRGIGKAICLRMAQEGIKVVLADILDKEAQQTAKEIRDMGSEALAVKADVTSVESTQRIAKQAIESFGRIDILVNNAGMIYGITLAPFTEIPLEEWDKIMAVNVKGVFLCCRAVFPQMKKQGKGKIINIASGMGFRGAVNFIHYGTSKGAVITLTRCLAQEVGQYGICVNSVAPGLTYTPGAMSIQDLDKFDTSRISLRRLGQPQDMVGAVMFLASDDSDYITGQALVVDGGQYMH